MTTTSQGLANSSLTITKLWGTPRSTVAVNIPNEFNFFPSVLRSVMCAGDKLVCGMCEAFMTEHEAPESNAYCTCTELSHILRTVVPILHSQNFKHLQY